MPEQATLERARRDAAQGKSASTQAGEFIREQIHHIREGRHGARSAKQAIAIGLSAARRAGVKLPAPKRGSVSAETRHKIEADAASGRRGPKAPSRTRSRATENALRRESTRTVSHAALSAQARSAARRRSSAERSASAKRAAATRKRS